MGDMQARSPPPLPRRTWVLPSPLGDSCSPSRRNLGMVGKGRGGNHQLLAAFLFLRGPGLASARDVLTQGQERCVRRREDAEELQREEISGEVESWFSGRRSLLSVLPLSKPSQHPV